MNESRELKNAEQLEELLLLTEEIQEELEQKDQLIVELKTQLNESLILNEKLNKENRAGNIQALKNDLKLADRALRNEKEKLRSANVMIGEYQNKIRCLTQQRDYARTHQKIVEIPVEKPVPYEKCEACDRTAYQNAKARYETQKEHTERDSEAGLFFRILQNRPKTPNITSKPINIIQKPAKIAPKPFSSRHTCREHQLPLP